MTQLVTFGETALGLSPADSERLESATEFRMRADGTESNVAVAATRMGTDCAWLSKLPDSPLGRRVVTELHAHGLDTEVVWADPETGRQGLSFFESGAAPRDPLRLQDRTGSVAGTAEPGELAMDLVQSAAAVFVAGSTPALSEKARETTEAVLRAAGGTRVLDLDFRPGLWDPSAERAWLDPLLGTVDVLVTSEADAQAVFEHAETGRDLLHAVAGEGDFEQVIVTRGEYGALAMVDNVVHERDAVPTEVVDAAGQHEAFVGAYLAAYLAGKPADHALDVGVAAAALTRTLSGAMTRVTREEVDRVVAGMNDDGH